LHAGWTKAASKDKYEPFHEALEAATDKLEEYYNKTAASDAHIISMGKVILFPSMLSGQLGFVLVLHPDKKLVHFKKYWSKPLQTDVRTLLQEKVIIHLFSSLII